MAASSSMAMAASSSVTFRTSQSSGSLTSRSVRDDQQPGYSFFRSEYFYKDYSKFVKNANIVARIPNEGEPNPQEPSDNMNTLALLVFIGDISQQHGYIF
nr:hypothetical protein Iba_chr13cCG12250 [Ipomoea batatas]